MNKTWSGILLLLSLAALLLSWPLTSPALAKKGDIQLTATPSSTPTGSATPTASPTATGSVTSTPTPTGSVTSTPTASPTPTGSSTPTMTAITVCASGCDYTTIQDAIDAATSGDTIEIQAGTYVESLTIDKDLTLEGQDQATTVIDANGVGSAVVIKPNRTVAIANLTIMNGVGDQSYSLETQSGGGIFNEGTLTVSNSTIDDNYGEDDGGGIFNVGTLTLLHSTVQNNASDSDGAGIFNVGTLTILSSTLQNNSTQADGGGIENENILTIENSTISDNSTLGDGPGINNSGTLTLTNSIVSDNTANNLSRAFGGAIHNTATIAGSTVDDNSVGDSANNLNTAFGGAVHNTGTATIVGSTLDDNIVGEGGGIYNANTLTLLDSVVSNNVSFDQVGSGSGGGIYNHEDAFMTLTNSTVSGNSIDDDGNGGGIYNEGSMMLTFSTISDNFVDDDEGSGIYNDGTTELTNSIVANNGGGDQCAGFAVTSLGHNLDSDGTCDLSATGDQPNTDPLLAPLADNGGLTFTHLPENSSPVIDHGDCSATSITSDQRGIARPQAAACDIGAVEVVPAVWNNEIVDSDGQVGSFTSLALDSNNQPHISYRDRTNRDLKYTRWDGSDWQIETVDSEGFVGYDTSLALDSNNRPHISYQDGTNGDLKYAYWDGSNWLIETVESEGYTGVRSSLALDSNDRPHIAYFSHVSGDLKLKYARWDGSNWLIEDVNDVIFNSASTSLALDSHDQPHISYYDWFGGDLKYASWDGARWVIEVVDSEGRAGYDNSLELDSNDWPHISYQERDNSDLKYARWNGSAWLIETVESNGSVGSYSSLELDHYDRPHIAYYSSSPNLDLKYTYWNGSDWLIETIDSDGNVGQNASLALDSRNQPHIGYYDNTNSNLKYAFASIPTLTVCASGCDHTSIQDAVDAANPGDKIEIEAGTYVESVTIDKDLTLEGEDQATTTIDANGVGSAVVIKPNRTVAMANLTIINGFGDQSDSFLTRSGGGIFNEGTLTLLNSTIDDNYADDNAGGILNIGTLTLLRSTVQNNRSTVAAGGILNVGTLTIENSTLENNLTWSSGGGIDNGNILTIFNSTISDNRTLRHGGAGINNSGTLTLTNSIVSNNVGPDSGNGGGIHNTGTATIVGSTVDGNSIATGGGIYNFNTLTLLDSVVSNNRTFDVLGPTHGSAIYNRENAFMALTNSTVSGNTIAYTIDDDNASAIYNQGHIVISFSTISNNTIDEGEAGGIYNDGTAELTNSIVANNSSGDQCGGLAITSLGHNLDSDGTCNLTATGDQPNTDPLLGPLGDNGGLTFTHLPLEGSPAIDHASSCPLITDQRGITRPQGIGCDIGAVEVVSESSCGGLIQEAETGMLNGYFTVGLDSAASGGQYVHVPNGLANSFNGPNPFHKADYCVTVETAGIYKIKSGIYAATGRDNSFFVQVDGSPINGYLWEFPKNTDYQIDEVSNRNGDDPVQVTLSEGEHTLSIFLREDGARLDTLEVELIEAIDPPPPVCDGLVREAEDGQLTGAFVVGDDTNASGGQYVHVPEGAGNSFNTPNPAHQAEYCFNVETAGTYRIKGGIYADSGRDNSFFVKVDDAPSSGYLWDFPKNTDYQEDNVSDRNGADPVEVELQTGPITVTVFLREDGARLDKLELVHVGTPSALPANEPMARGIFGTLIVNNYQGEEEELDLTGIKVTLQEANTRLDEPSGALSLSKGSDTAYNETTETDHLGQYYFDEMAPGNYQLTLELPNGYQVSEANEVQVTTDADKMVEQSFTLEIAENNPINIYLPMVIR